MKKITSIFITLTIALTCFSPISFAMTKKDLVAKIADAADLSKASDSFTGELTSLISKFEGLENSYSKKRNANIANKQVQIDRAREKMVTAGEELMALFNDFNEMIQEAYADLTEEEKITVNESYSALRSYFSDLDEPMPEISKVKKKILGIIDAISF